MIAPDEVFQPEEIENFPDGVNLARLLPAATRRPCLVGIDGRSGATMYSESYREEILYNAQQTTPALSSYFELMDRLVPNFLSTLSSQKIRGSRVLLK